MPTDLEKHLAGRIAGLALDARRAIYDEARAGLQSEVRAAAPFMPVQTVVARRRELENAIIAVEKEAARSDSSRPFVPDLRKSVPPEPPIPSNAETAALATEPELGQEITAEQDEAYWPEAASNEIHAKEAPPPDITDAPAAEEIAEIAVQLPEENSTTQEWPPASVPEDATTLEHIEESSERLPPVKSGRPLLLYGGVLALVVCAVALAAAIVGIGLDQAQERAAPVAAAPASVAPVRPVPELIQSAGFQTAAQEAIKDGNTHLARREFDRAIASFDDAIRLDPSATAYGNRAFANWNKGNTAAAILDYGAAIERDPSNAVNRLNRAIAYNREGEYQRAIDDLDRVLAADPSNANALNSRCWARAVSAHLQEALSDCNEALRIRSDDPDALDSRGFVYLRLGRLDRAIADYTAALKVQPKHAGSLYGRGLAKIGRGDRAGGNEDVVAARAIDPDIVAAFSRYGIR